MGHSDTQAGVAGVSEQFVGVWGELRTVDENGKYHPCVLGLNNFGEAVVGVSKSNTGVQLN